MGHNVQAQAGISLSDIYDIKGGQAPIERLITTEVPVVHEMGNTIWSERFSQTIRRRQTAALAQSVAISEEIADFPNGPWMLHGITLFADVAARLDTLNVQVRDPVSGREELIWGWAVGDLARNLLIDDGTGAVVVSVMAPPLGLGPHLPRLMSSTQSQQSVPAIIMRGATSGFGAGTVTVTLMLHISFTDRGGSVSNYGLPVPSW